jgi:hypothetical protein
MYTPSLNTYTSRQIRAANNAGDSVNLPNFRIQLIPQIMKTTILSTFAFVALASVVNAQSQTDSKFVYCEIVGNEKSRGGRSDAVVNFGEKMNPVLANKVQNSKGQPMVFDRMIDALNFMAKQGWRLAQSYAVPYTGNNTSSGVMAFRYVLMKSYSELTEDEKRAYDAQ